MLLLICLLVVDAAVVDAAVINLFLAGDAAIDLVAGC